MRWRRLSDVVKTLLILGGVGLTYTFDREPPATLRYEVRAIRDRTAGPDRVILSEVLADQDYDVRPGDRVTLEGYFRSESVVPELAPTDLLCLGRSVKLRPGRPSEIFADVGSADPDLAAVLKAQESRTLASQVR